MTKQEFVLDFINTYVKDPSKRCVLGNRCRYSPVTLGKTYDESPGCAVGKWLPPELALDLDKEFAVSISSFLREDREYSSELLEIFSGLGDNLDEIKDFLTEIQMLHDHNSNFSETGLTPMGRQYMDKIIEKYRLDIPESLYHN